VVGASWFGDVAIILAFIALLLVGGLLDDVFLSPRNLESILVASSILVVVAVGQTIVIITAGIDLSIGSLMMLSGVMIGVAVKNDLGVPVGIVLAIGTTALLGMVNGLVITRGKISDFIATLGMMSIALGIGQVISEARPVPIIDAGMTALATGSIGPMRWIVLLAVVVAVVVHILLFNTRFGTYLLATGGNYEGSRDLGIHVSSVKVRAYLISGTLAGLGGVMLTSRIGSAEPTAGPPYLLTSIAATVLGGVSLFGGRGTILGPVVGALILTALLNLMTILGIGVLFQPIVIGIVVIGFAIAYRFRQ
jgi:ribose/xylose/arabinose/galactoside ABC-type transport system permease subunit